MYFYSASEFFEDIAMDLKRAIIAVEAAALIALYFISDCLCPDKLIVHKTCSHANAFSSVSDEYLILFKYGLVFLSLICLPAPFVRRKVFCYVFLLSIIFYLYLFCAIVISILSLNCNSVFLEVAAWFSLFFAPLLGLYLLICLIAFCCKKP